MSDTRAPQLSKTLELKKWEKKKAGVKKLGVKKGGENLTKMGKKWG